MDLSKNVELTQLRLNANLLTKLDVSSNNKLFKLVCEDNKFTAESLNAMFETLHNNPSQYAKRVFIAKSSGDDDCEKSIAESKGREVIMDISFSLSEYNILSLTGVHII